MNTIELSHPADFPHWHEATRQSLARSLTPDQINWQVRGASGSLFGSPTAGKPSPSRTQAPALPKPFLRLARQVICHRHPGRLARLYRVAWRLHHGEPKLLSLSVDEDMHFLQRLAQAVRRDAHKMKAFVRFREVDDEMVAWFEPAFHIVDALAPFFVRRFSNEKWTILTPERCARWDGQSLNCQPASTDQAPPDADRLEDFWRRYYASIFNPARLKVRMMRQEMPRRYWKHLPEAGLIPELIAAANRRATDMLDDAVSEPARKGRTRYHRATPPAPANTDPLAQLNQQLSACRRCPLWQPATQAVPGSGPADARLMLIGEQPGDQEDLRGLPFTGPAGKVLDGALNAVGIERDTLYLSNTVKHFHFDQRGKQRLHQTPKPIHIEACRPWLEQELALIRPQVVVTLGAVALRGLSGRPEKLADIRGQVIRTEAFHLIPTWHPAAILRSRHQARLLQDLETDLARARELTVELAGPQTGIRQQA